MRKQIVVTTLFSGDNVSDRTYYYSRTGSGRTLYCDALMSAEAACRFMLATRRIHEIIVLASEAVVTPEDDPEPMALREGESFFASDLGSLSRYNLLRYRLAEYIEELRAEGLDNDLLLSAQEQKETAVFLRRFFDEHIRREPDKRLNRYFHLLAQDAALQEALDEALRAWAPAEDLARVRAWAFHFLYRELKASGRMEPLEGNEDVRIRLVPVKDGDSSRFLSHMMGTLDQSGDPESTEGADLYLCLQNSEASVILDIINLNNLAKMLPGNRVLVRKMLTVTCRPGRLADEIMDRTDFQNVAELLSGAGAFLDYGKTDSIVRCWKQANVDNPRIERIIYAMRNIDTGISLCDIGDIERGIRSLRSLLSDREPIGEGAPVEYFFDILQEGIRRDYGPLLETEQVRFIDLVRWAYRKEFWQQTLTLIESRAPQDFVERGFYYYCGAEEKREETARIFAQIYYDLRSYEKYKLDDVSHYFVKFYNRQKASRQKHGREYVQSYARVRAAELDTETPGELRAYTACPDRGAVEDLLFAYYYLGNVRNQTNHAEDSFDGFYEIMEDSDSSERMEMIRQCIKYFLHCYDRVARLTGGAAPQVVQITSAEITQYASELRGQSRNRGR